jgi:hypothetical protein
VVKIVLVGKGVELEKISDPKFTLRFAERRGIQVKQARGEELPFPDRSFGGVLMIAKRISLIQPLRRLSMSNTRSRKCTICFSWPKWLSEATSLRS